MVNCEVIEHSVQTVVMRLRWQRNEFHLCEFSLFPLR